MRAFAIALIFLASAPLNAQQLLKDVRPGSEDSGIIRFLAVGDIVYFNADDGVHGNELWRTDGTEAGTFMVRDIWPGEGDGIFFVVGFGIDDLLYFIANDGARGSEWWVSDGTETGTQLLTEIYPGPDGAHPFYPRLWQGQIYFPASDGSGIGREFWRLDPATGEAVLVKDINPGDGDSNPDGLVEVGDYLLFSAYDGVHGVEIWRTDGTEAGTQLAADVRPGPVGGVCVPAQWIIGAVGEYAFFEGCSDPSLFNTLWRTDGTEFGTQLVSEVRPGRLVGYTSARDMLFQGFTEATGSELWLTDGTTAGTRLVLDIRPGEEGSLPQAIVEHEGILYFSASDSVGFRRLWRTDGTTGGTSMLPGVRAGSWGISVDAGFLFEGRSEDLPGDAELWGSNGGNVSLLADINPGPTGSFPSRFHRAGDLVFFTADDGVSGEELWVLPTSIPTGVVATPSPSGTSVTVVGPNPFYGTTTLGVELDEPQDVRVEVFDALGRRVVLLHDGPLEAGAAHRLSFDGQGHAAGVYLWRLEAGGTVQSGRLTLLR